MLRQVQHDIKQGLLLCARYSVAPNFYGYCGPPQNSSLVDHLKENIADAEVKTNLSEFETLYLYLQLISKENKVLEPFDKNVVEAYWIGNSLLQNIKNKNYLYLLQEKFAIEKKIDRENYRQIKTKILDSYFLPHHSFHVFNIFRRTGHDPSFHTLKTMDECRIGWGQIKEISKINKSFLKVKSRQLVVEAHCNAPLQLGEPILKEIKIDYKGIRFIPDLKIGDWISFHWGFACDILSARQVRNLEFYTQQSINFYNSR